MISLPLPPSVNELYRQAAFKGGRGRTVTPKYAAWREKAGECLSFSAWDMPKPPYGVTHPSQNAVRSLSDRHAVRIEKLDRAAFNGAVAINMERVDPLVASQDAMLHKEIQDRLRPVIDVAAMIDVDADTVE